MGGDGRQRCRSGPAQPTPPNGAGTPMWVRKHRGKWNRQIADSGLRLPAIAHGDIQKQTRVCANLLQQSAPRQRVSSDRVWKQIRGPSSSLPLPPPPFTPPGTSPTPLCKNRSLATLAYRRLHAKASAKATSLIDNGQTWQLFHTCLVNIPCMHALCTIGKDSVSKKACSRPSNFAQRLPTMALLPLAPHGVLTLVARPAA